MIITYKEQNTPSTESLVTLYVDCGWNAYAEHPEKLKQALDHSDYVVSAYEDNDLAGLIRCVSDKTSIVFIQDLLVLKRSRRKGIATALIHRVISHYPSMRFVLLTDNDD